MENDLITIDIEIPFPTQLLAQTIYNVLVVDSEPKRSQVTKEIRIDDTTINVKLTAKLAKHVRVATTAFFENLNLIIDTINSVGEPTHKGYYYI